MNLNLYFGKTNDGKRVEYDLKRDGIHTIFLTGSTGTGKSILHNLIYKQLVSQNTDKELGFVFLDMTRVDFTQWNTPYLHCPVITDAQKALDYLTQLSENPPKDKIIIVHIEECDMMNFDRQKFEQAWERIQKLESVFVIFSTSRPSPTDVFTPEIKKHTDMVITGALASNEDSITVLGKPRSENFKSIFEKNIKYKEEQLNILPFSQDEVQKAYDFDKEMSKK